MRRPVIKTVNHILQKAVEDRASDIHFEPFERVLKIRMRIDGVLFEVEDLTAVSSAAVLSRIKLMAKNEYRRKAFTSRWAY